MCSIRIATRCLWRPSPLAGAAGHALTHLSRARGWTGRKARFSNVRYDPTGNRTQPTGFGGKCSIPLYHGPDIDNIGFKPRRCIGATGNYLRMSTFELSSKQVAEPSLQERSDASHEEDPHTPSRGPKATSGTFADRAL